MKKLRISQSLIKEFEKYDQHEQCGLLFDALYVSRTHRMPPTDAMLMGQWFEFLCTGDVPRDADRDALGEYFADGMKASGKKNLVAWNGLLKDGEGGEHIPKDWTTKYVNLYQQAQHFKDTLAAYDIEILATQHKIELKGKAFDRVMVADVIARVHAMPDPTTPGSTYEPHVAIIDIKSTGLFNDKWQDYGWDTHTIVHRPAIITQPLDYMDILRDYKFTFESKAQQPERFYFFVHSNTNALDRKIIEVEAFDLALDRHRARVQEIHKEILFLQDIGWVPRPTLQQCNGCPLYGECAHRAEHPKPNYVSIL